ncbi:MAG: hypothetical protein LC131_02325 [Anaerolineae bacterium]|nr:hypothetical protein [Anaerolineae bacterium]
MAKNRTAGLAIKPVVEGNAGVFEALGGMSALVADSLAGLSYAQANALDNMSATYGLTSVIAKTDNANISATDSQAILTNNGATKNITLTLPVGVGGLAYTFFVKENTKKITIAVQSGEAILGNTGACESATANDWITLVCIASKTWARLGAKGTWDAG